MQALARYTIVLIAAAAWPGQAALSAQGADTLWTIRGGTYAGQTVRVDPATATSRGGKFWRLSRLRTDPRIVGWNPSRLPIAVAFRPSAGIGEADSVAFWTVLRNMEQDLGMHLFAPALLDAGTDPDDVIVVDLKPMAKDDGVTLITWTNHGSLYDARVFFRSNSTLHNERVVTHEMMHALGFGHTSSWYSIMDSRLSYTRRLTRDDVAYVQLAIRSRIASEREDMWERLALAVSREIAEPLEDSSCELFTPPVRSPAECRSGPCSVLSASCRAARNIEPLPER